MTAKKASNARSRFNTMYEEIRERICLLIYPPGMRLSEEALALEFGVSRTPIRRVLASLEATGLVESRHGVGTVVTTIGLAKLREIYALRMRLAELIGELDPRPPGAADIARLRGLLASLEALRDRPDALEYSRINMAFQHELLKVIGNEALRRVSEMLYYQTSRFFVESATSMDLVEEIDIFHQEVSDIVGALERKDMRGVGLVRRTHIAWSVYRMMQGAERSAGHRKPAETAAAPQPLEHA
ncbi:MAG TPA: GntR family transcriptional regulator [Alphaproteobacteria bacterium]|nr:GntR family transcriptional regulator [Alphaproteobacteria bacterium]